MEESICGKRAFSQNIVAKPIFKYVNSLTDIAAIGKLAKDIYINASNFSINKVIKCESSYFFLDINKNDNNSGYNITRFLNSKENIDVDNEIERLLDVSREVVENSTKITIALSDVFNKLTVNDCYLYGEKLAIFVDRLFTIFINAQILEIAHLSSEERNGFLFYFLMNLKSNNIKIIDGIAFEDIIIFSFRHQEEKLDIFNGLKNLIEISIYKQIEFNSLSQHPKVKENVYHLIHCLSKKKECTISFYRVDHPLSNDFLMEIITYAQKHNIYVKFDELSYPFNDFIDSWLRITNNVNNVDIKNITEISISLSKISEINADNKWIVSLENLKCLRLHIQYDLYKTLIKGNCTTSSCIKIIYETINQSNFKKLKNLKWFYLQFPRMLWFRINKKKQEIQENLFQYIAECLISILPNSITLLSLASVPIKNNNFFQIISENLPNLTKLLIKQNCIIPRRSLKYLKNLKFVSFPYGLKLTIPNWTRIVVVFHENPVVFRRSSYEENTEEFEKNILQSKLYNSLRNQYKNSVFYDDPYHSQVYIFFNSVFEWESYIRLSLLLNNSY
uniref:FPL domain-containing protein n=1 Tax=Strongyloides papillosus TaxID=174720 RepID=A0A0N5B5C0_STREA